MCKCCKSTKPEDGFEYGVTSIKVDKAQNIEGNTGLFYLFFKQVK